MSPNRPLTLASLIATVSLTALTMTGSVHAQVPARPAPPSAAAPAPPTRAAIEQRMAERRAQRTNDLATVLRLTPAQRPALNAFVASQTPPRRDPATAQARRSLTPQQRLDERQAFATKRAESLRTFTAVLNPEQKQVLEALNRLRGPDGRGRGGDRFGGPGRRDGGMGMRGPGGRDDRGGRGGRGGMNGQRGPGAPPPPAR